MTLDEEKRELDPQDLLITDSPEGEGSRIIGIAGVMGGAYSEVGEGTTDVLFEAAHFDSVSVARSSRRHKLHSEAAKRFERGTTRSFPRWLPSVLSSFSSNTAEAPSTPASPTWISAVRPRRYLAARR